MNKKAITPVVATALLLVVVVVAVVGFQDWIQTYQSSLNTKTQQQSSQSTTTTLIESLINSNLYFRNGYTSLTISDIKVDDKSCNISGNYSFGIQTISLANCMQNLTTSTPDVVVITDKGVFSKDVYINGVVLVSKGVASLDCSKLSGGVWIKVPGNSTLGTKNFCVMKYDAKNVGGVATSQTALTPWASLTWQQAKVNCNALGTGYHLITEKEWFTISKNIEQVPQNWNSSVVGTGFVFLGHNDNNPAGALNASLNDSDGYYGTADSLSSCDGVYNNALSTDETTSGRSCGGQRRTLYLSNGNVIWDFSGNVWEWVNDSMSYTSRYYGGANGWMSYNSDDGTGKIATSPTFPAFMLPDNGWNANNGMGRYIDGSSLVGTYNTISESPDLCTGYCSPTAVFLNGGAYNNGDYAGIFALDLNAGPSFTDPSIGFRCSYTP